MRANIRQHPVSYRVLLPKPPNKVVINYSLCPKQSNLLYLILIYQDVFPLTDKNQVKRVMMKGVIISLEHIVMPFIFIPVISIINRATGSSGFFFFLSAVHPLLLLAKML